MDGLMETFEYVGVLMPSLLQGTWETVKLFVVTLLLSLPLGLPFALGGNSRFRILRAISKTYIWIFRGTPLLLQLFFFYYFLPIWFGEAFRFDVFTTAAFTFILNYAAYFAEIYRGGINSIDRGQYEAAHSLGLSKSQTMLGIILPQTMKCVLPPVSNEAIVLIKDTALVSCIGVADLMKNASSAMNRDVNATAYLIAAIIYLIFTFLLTLLSNYLERRYSVYDAKED
jgi:polar amino acid transport system permease protein